MFHDTLPWNVSKQFFNFVLQIDSVNSLLFHIWENFISLKTTFEKLFKIFTKQKIRHELSVEGNVDGKGNLQNINTD